MLNVNVKALLLPVTATINALSGVGVAIEAGSNNLGAAATEWAANQELKRVGNAPIVKQKQANAIAARSLQVNEAAINLQAEQIKATAVHTDILSKANHERAVLELKAAKRDLKTAKLQSEIQMLAIQTKIAAGVPPTAEELIALAASSTELQSNVAATEQAEAQVQATAATF